jgi:hypothetical protein
VPEAAPEQFAAAGNVIPPRKRVRVRVRRQYRRAKYRGPSVFQVLLSFGQWVRYSFRSWLFYR